MPRAFVLSYNQGPWDIQVAAIQAASPQVIAEGLKGDIYFEMDTHARIKLPREVFAMLPFYEPIKRHVLEASDAEFHEPQSEIRLRLTETPFLSF